MSDQNTHDLIAAVAPILSALALGIFWYFRSKMAEAAMKSVADAAAVKVEQVKADLHTANVEKNAKLDNLTDLGEKTHALVNSAMGAQLRLTAETARAKADVTHDPADIAAANTAERLLAEHQVKQARADAGEGNP